MIKGPDRLAERDSGEAIFHSQTCRRLTERSLNSPHICPILDANSPRKPRPFKNFVHFEGLSGQAC